MVRTVGTVARAIRTPIIREGDDLAGIVCDSIINAAAEEKFTFNDMDIIGVTEAVVARAQGNYAGCGDIARDIAKQFPGGEIGVVFPILSRNRFAVCFRGIAMGVKKIYLQLSYPADEVGNHLLSLDDLDEKGIDPFKHVMTEDQYYELFGSRTHLFTGIDYIAYYRQLAEEAGAEIEIIFANDARAVLSYTKQVLVADIHSRDRSKRLLAAAGAEKVVGLDDILTEPINGSGYNPAYGLLGSNKAADDKIKLFPRDGEAFVHDVQRRMMERTGKHIEVLIYGDGAFKDPVGKIWELADPVVSPAYTKGLEGQPNELKLKYLADNEFAALSGEDLQTAVRERIGQKAVDLKGDMVAEGTTPRRLTDLIGSLCDLMSGSGDKGTPVVLVQGYFENYAS
jgi:F420-0:gamma-glutamyl ligase